MRKQFSTPSNDNFHQGFVYYADLRSNVIGSEQDGIRPMVVMQNDMGNKYSNTLIVAPITKEFTHRRPNQRKKHQRTQVTLNATSYDFLNEDSKIITEQIRTIDKKRIISPEKVGCLSDDDYIRLQSSAIISLGLVEQHKNSLIKRGDIYLADLGKGVGCEFRGLVPVVVIQNNIGNEYSPTVIIIPIKLSSGAKLPTHVLLEGKSDPLVNINRDCVILAEQIRTIDKERLISHVGLLSTRKMKEVDDSIINSLAIDKRLIEYINTANKISHTVLKGSIEKNVH